MKRPCWVRTIEGFHQGLFFLHGLGSLDLLDSEQCLDLLPQGLCASKIPVLVGLSFAHHFRMDSPQWEDENKDDQRKEKQKYKEKRGIHTEKQISIFTSVYCGRIRPKSEHTVSDEDSRSDQEW